MTLPLWLHVLRLYCHYSPIARGKFKLVLHAYQRLSIPDVEVGALLDQRLRVQLRLKIWVDFNIYCIGLYEHYLAAFFKRQLTPDTVFVDVGAYIGQYALLAAHHAPKGLTYAFEPLNESANRLRRSVETNHLPNLRVVEQAVGEHAGSVTFYVSSQPSMSSVFASHTPFNRAMTVAATTLDTFWAENRPQKIDIIKIDAEEAEDQVIRGGLETLRRFAPLLIMEVSANQPGQSIKLLGSLGYNFFALNRKRLSALTRGIDGNGNVIAIPSRNLERYDLRGIG
jgi:FkbM family methyltransferase